MPISIADLQSLQKSMDPSSANYQVIQHMLDNPALLNSGIGQNQLANVLGTAQQDVSAQQNPTYTYTDPGGQRQVGTSVPAGATNIGSSASQLSSTFNPATVSSLQQQLANNPAASYGIPPSATRSPNSLATNPFDEATADANFQRNNGGATPSTTLGGNFRGTPRIQPVDGGPASDTSSGGNFTAIGGGGNPQPVSPSPAGPDTSTAGNFRGTPGMTPLSASQSSSGFQYRPISINNPTLQTNFPGDIFRSSGYNIPSGPSPAGANPAYPNWTNTPGGNGQGYQGGDPGYMASAEANRAVDVGNTFENQYGTQYQQALNQQNLYQGQADTAYGQLAQTPGYTDQEAQAIQADPYAVQGVVGQTADAMNGAIDPSKLGVSDQYVQQLKDQAAGQIGAQYGANMDSLRREADASGNVNPLALAAARNRYLQSQSIDSANALTNADIAATGAQRQANTNIANMRLGAATTLGGMGLQAGQYADTAASNRAANVAQQRIQGQQAARNYWQSQSQFQGGQANQATQARLAGAQTSLSGMGQGGALAAQTEIGRKATANRLNVGVGPGGVSVGTSVGI